ncbi:MAG: hypothetical protein GWO07_02445 [Candidatus Dadabacteria bacterium]|nr:hypothetical protein [Candidatus Dadabacteria bacterium]NIS07628.1 hypothetical protein [Candidatus Dadabacteria bacterium]NIV42082.1 hypothetical protein [Candidatus Dadabacteria bacterium]NIX16487.1 hypothetical protein [Candidatus Dadabacteria bacterium]NIY21266.1 hypothetical protein [Candidatus Dadabacteria bacterium]
MKIIGIIAVIIIAAAAFFLWPASDDPTEIEKVLNKMITAGQTGTFEGVTEHVSFDYRDDYGATYFAVKNIVQKVFEKFDSFDTKHKNLSVTISESEDGSKIAIANLDMNIKGKKSNTSFSILGKDDSYENITLTFKKSKLGEWKVTKSEGLDRTIEEGY